MRWVHDLHPSGGQGSEVSPAAYIPVLVATPGPRRHPLQLQAATTYPFDVVAGVPPCCASGLLLRAELNPHMLP